MIIGSVVLYFITPLSLTRYLGYLHFVNNDVLQHYGSDGYDRLGKVKPIIDHLVGKYLEMYNHKQVSIDEDMIPYKRRNSTKQYLPKEPGKRGFKIWMSVRDSTRLGTINQQMV